MGDTITESRAYCLIGIEGCINSIGSRLRGIIRHSRYYLELGFKLLVRTPIIRCVIDEFLHMLIPRTFQYLARQVAPQFRLLVPSLWLYPFSSKRRYAIPVNPLPIEEEPSDEDEPPRRSKIRETMGTTTATLVCLGIAGYSYHKYYKWLTLKKIENAFQRGDPALDLLPRAITANNDEGQDNAHWVVRFLSLIWI